MNILLLILTKDSDYPEVLMVILNYMLEFMNQLKQVTWKLLLFRYR